MKKTLQALALAAALFSFIYTPAQPPADYYNNAAGLDGQELRASLHYIINGHTRRTYNNLWTDFYQTDRKPNDSVWCIYTDIPDGTPVYEFTFYIDQQGTGGASAEGQVYNREHSFPTSWWGGGSSASDTMYTDLFHIHPVDAYINTIRSNWPYGIVCDASHTFSNGSKRGPNCYDGGAGYDGTAFEIIDAYKGDIARNYFYMLTRYLSRIEDWEATAPIITGNDFEEWALAMLLEWHAADPVSQKEIDRNNAIYAIQGNRNPFIDHPEYVNMIWNNIINPVPSNHVTNFAADATAPDQITVTWTDAIDGDQPPLGYLIKAAANPDIPAAPVDGTPEYTSQLTKRIAHGGNELVAFNNLDPNTLYNFAIYPYSNSGSNILYKVDGTPPSASESINTLHTNENFGSPSGTTAVSAFNGWQLPYPVKYSGTADVRTTSSSSGYEGASGNGNIFFTSSIGTYFLIEGLNTIALTNPQLSLGHYKSTIASNNELLIEVSADGTNWSELAYSRPTGSGTANWLKINPTGTIPSAQNLRIRFTQQSGTNSWRIDDIEIIGFTGPTATSSTGSLDWENPSGWSNGFPGYGSSVTIADNITLSSQSAVKNLTINNGATLTLSPDAALSVSDNLTNNGSLILQSNAASTASLIHNEANVPATVHRYVSGGWQSMDAGWHMISSPVQNEPIENFATVGEGNDFDLYGWDEPSRLYMNFKAETFEAWNNGTAFNPGQGYFISYETTQPDRQFSGELNAASISQSNMSHTGLINPGWHLLGNPYPSALLWNTSDNAWQLNNVSGIAKIWHAENKSFTDIPPEGIIPAAQGFFVQAVDPVNNVTIPLSARTHSAHSWLKSHLSPKTITLAVSESETLSKQETHIRIDPSASESFDFHFDSRFFPGNAPQFYAVIDNEKLSTKTLPALNSETVIPLSFTKNRAANFTLELYQNNLNLITYLTDLKTNNTHNLSQNPYYTFTAHESDNTARFLLHFGFLNTSETPYQTEIIAYYHQNTLHLSNIPSPSKLSILDIQGRTHLSMLLPSNPSHTIPLNLPNGIYIVQLNSQYYLFSTKIAVLH